VKNKEVGIKNNGGNNGCYSLFIIPEKATTASEEQMGALAYPFALSDAVANGSVIIHHS